VILVLNSGSSSVKNWLSSGEHGLAERITDHDAAVRQILDDLPVSRESITAVGHRVVHGGARFTAPVLIDDDVIAGIEELVPLAPLHNPGSLAGIKAARAALPDVPQVASFDTAFHANLPAAAATYAIDREVAERWGIRRYGFHGLSYRYVSARTAEVLGRPLADLNLIVLHLGNGASATAVRGGESVDTSMGLTPLEGLVMGTRSGDIDAAAIFHLWRAGLDVAEIDATLNGRSGLYALAGDNDLREVNRRIAAGDERAALALDVYCYRIRKYVGAYTAVLGRVDAIVFTAGVGENDPVVRSRALAGLETLGVEIHEQRNALRSPEPRVVSGDGSRVAVLVVPTDEEREMAAQAIDLVVTAADAP
jgi:acetate kinase